MSTQKGFAPILILIIVAVLTLGGYLIYKQYYKSVSPPQSIIQSSPSPSSTPQSKSITSPSPKPSSVKSTSQPKSTPTPTTSLSPTSKTSLNPNTGNLYSDIKVRLNEVIK